MKDANPYRYAGYRYDNETGLYYLMARYYDPNVGRFITRDSFNGSPNKPLSLNQYTYTENNPVIMVDPGGHFPYKLTAGWIAFGLAVAALLGAPVWVGATSTILGFAILGYDLYYVIRHKYSFRKSVSYIGLDIWNAGGKVKGLEHLVTFGIGHASLIIDSVKYWLKKFHVQ
jgi:RHS repeat-associated protein